MGLAVTPGAGATINTDLDGSSNHHQAVLLEWGATGTQTRVASTAPLPCSLGDGTNFPVAVKAANTPAALADKAIVVAISPNSPLTKPTAGSPLRTSVIQALKTTAGSLFGLTGVNTGTTTIWLQFFDAASAASVSIGVNKPDLEYVITTSAQQINPVLPADGVPFVNGIVYAATTLEGAVGTTLATTGTALLFPQWV